MLTYRSQMNSANNVAISRFVVKRRLSGAPAADPQEVDRVRTGLASSPTLSGFGGTASIDHRYWDESLSGTLCLTSSLHVFWENG